MDEKEKAAAICDKIGLTDENERFWFIRGYCRGAIDARIEHINEAIDRQRMADHVAMPVRLRKGRPGGTGQPRQGQDAQLRMPET